MWVAGEQQEACHEGLEAKLLPGNLDGRWGCSCMPKGGVSTRAIRSGEMELRDAGPQEQAEQCWEVSARQGVLMTAEPL